MFYSKGIEEIRVYFGNCYSYVYIYIYIYLFIYIYLYYICKYIYIDSWIYKHKDKQQP